MTGDRMAVVVRDLAANGIGRRRLPAAVSATCASLLDIDHSGLLLADDDGNLTALATTTPMMALVEDLEVTLGAGPCTEAYRHGRPVEETDLAGADRSRWLGSDVARRITTGDIDPGDLADRLEA